MHEMAITQNILDIVLDTAKQSNAKKVSSVTLVVGSLAQVVPDCVSFYFELMSKDTIAEGAEFIVKDVPAKAECAKCGTVFEAEDMSLKCPECGELFGKLISGRELSVESIDVD
jgi:hydrogenase nickel incorporation protein HypA/HybF